jgi:hypothetical protein
MTQEVNIMKLCELNPIPVEQLFKLMLNTGSLGVVQNLLCELEKVNPALSKDEEFITLVKAVVHGVFNGQLPNSLIEELLNNEQNPKSIWNSSSSISELQNAIAANMQNITRMSEDLDLLSSCGRNGASCETAEKLIRKIKHLQQETHDLSETLDAIRLSVLERSIEKKWNL